MAQIVTFGELIQEKIKYRKSRGVQRQLFGHSRPQLHLGLAVLVSRARRKRSRKNINS